MVNRALRRLTWGAGLCALGGFPACSSSESAANATNTAGGSNSSMSAAGTANGGGVAGTSNASGNAGNAGATSATAGSGGSTANAGAGGTEPQGGAAGSAGTANAGAGGAPLVMGNLTFTRQTLHTFNYAEGVGIADLNGDGAVDVASGPFWWEGPAFTIQHQYFPPPPDNEYTGMSLGDWADYTWDIDGDGPIDLITVMRPSTPSYWYKNPGPAGIDAEVSAWEQHVVGTLVLEQSMFTDLTGDGLPDLVGAQDGQFGWFDWGSTTPWTFNEVAPCGATIAYAWWHGVGVGDLDGDGQNDLLTDHAWYTRPAAGPKSGLWVEHVQRFKGDNVADEHGPSHMFGYDVDDDGDEDVITALDSHAYGVAWYENDAGTFAPHVIVGDENSMTTNAGMIAPFSQPHAMVVADIDGDGVKDLVTGKSFYAHPPGMGDPDADGTPVFYVFKLIRDATGVTWEPHLVDSEVGLGRQFSTGDLNNDGKVDIAVASKHGVFLFFQG